MRGVQRPGRRSPDALLRHPGLGRRRQAGDDRRRAGRPPRCRRPSSRSRRCSAATARRAWSSPRPRSSSGSPTSTRTASGGRSTATCAAAGRTTASSGRCSARGRARDEHPEPGEQPPPGQLADPAPGGPGLVRSGKVELGQGVLTALAQIVAEELDVDPARIEMVAAATDASPDESYTAGSLSVQHSGDALRAVCAQVRALHLAAAARAVRRPGRRPHAGRRRVLRARRPPHQLLGARRRPARPGRRRRAAAKTRRLRVVGRSMPRLDLPDKVAGRPRVHPRPPPGRHAARPGAAAAVPGRRPRVGRRRRGPAVPGVVAVVRDGSFLGVVAEREENALRALAALRTASVWTEQDCLPDERELAEFLVAAPPRRRCSATPPARRRPAARSVRARFTRPYLAHASIAPSCGLAVWDGGRLSVWSHSQGDLQAADGDRRLRSWRPRTSSSGTSRAPAATATTPPTTPPTTRCCSPARCPVGRSGCCGRARTS